MTFKYLFNNMENMFLETALLIILFAVSTVIGYAVTVVVASSLVGVCVGIVAFLSLFIFFIN